MLDKLTYAGQPGEPRGRRARVRPRRHRRPRRPSRAPRAGCDAIVNFAAETHVDRSILGPQDFVHTDVLGTMCLLEWARATGARYVQVSTDEVYGDLEAGGRAVETIRCARRAPTARPRPAATCRCSPTCAPTASTPRSRAARTPTGRTSIPEKLVPLFVTNALEGEPLPVYGDGKQVREWLHAEDHCAGIELVLHEGAPGRDLQRRRRGSREHRGHAPDPRADRRRPVADPPRRGSRRPRPALRDRRREAAGARLGAAALVRRGRPARHRRLVPRQPRLVGADQVRRLPAPTTRSSTQTGSRPEPSYREQFGEAPLMRHPIVLVLMLALVLAAAASRRRSPARSGPRAAPRAAVGARLRADRRRLRPRRRPEPVRRARPGARPDRTLPRTSSRSTTPARARRRRRSRRSGC